MAFDYNRLRLDQLQRIKEVGGDFNQLTLEELEEIKDSQEDVGDLEAGLKIAESNIRTGVAGIASLLGFDEFAQGQLKEAQDESEELQARYTRDVPTFDSIQDIGDFGEYLKETAATSLVPTAIGLGGGVLGGIAGTAVAGPAGGVTGALAGATAFGTPFFTGSNINRQMEELGLSFEDADKAKALGVGVGQAALDSIIGRLFGLFGRGAPKEITKYAAPTIRGRAVKLGKKVGEGAVIEGITEPAQQALELIQANPDKFFEMPTEVRAELVEAAIAGGLLGGILGGVTSPFTADPTAEAKEDLDRHAKELQQEQGRRQFTINKYEEGVTDQRLLSGPRAPRPVTETVRSVTQPSIEGAPPAPPELSEDQALAKALGTYQVELDLARRDGDLEKVARIENFEIPRIEKKIEERQQARETDARLQSAVENILQEARQMPLVIDPEIESRNKIDNDPVIENADLTEEEAVGLSEVVQDARDAQVGKSRESETAEEFELEAPEGQAPTAMFESDVRNLEVVRAFSRHPELGDLYNELVELEAQPQKKAFPINAKKKKIRDLLADEPEYIVEEILNETPSQKQEILRLSQVASEKDAQEARQQASNFTDEIAPKGVTIDEKRVFDRQVERVRKMIGRRLRKLGLKEIDVALDDTTTAQAQEEARADAEARGQTVSEQSLRNILGGREGSLSTRGGRFLMSIAYKYIRPGMTDKQVYAALSQVMNHELIHAMKQMGLFTANEWSSLTQAVRKQRYVDEKGNVRKFSYFDRAQALYSTEELRAEGGYESLEAMQEEEAIAELFRDYRVPNKRNKMLQDESGPLTKIFRKIVNFFKGIAGDINKEARDIFESIESGELGRRDRDSATAEFDTVRRSIKTAENPFGVDLNRTVLPIYPEKYIARRKSKNKIVDVPAYALTGPTQFTPNKTRLLDAARWMQDFIRERTGIGTETIPYTEDNVEPLSELMATEALRALQEDNNAIGWYDGQISSAKKILQKVEPRIFESPIDEAVFDWSLAVTSNGQAVADNFGLALEVFRFYKDKGRLPVKELKKGGDRNGAMRSSFNFFNQYQDMFNNGDVSMPIYEFLDSEFTVRELQQVIGEMNSEFGTDISVPTDELQDTVVFGSYLAGPKIGQGFYQNLRGNFEPLTMDIWWMRMWNRYVNRPFKPETSKAVITKKRAKSRNKILELAKTSEEMQIILGLKKFTFPNKSQTFKGALDSTGLKLSDLRKNDEFDNFTQAFNKAWNRYYRAFREAYGKPPEKAQIFNDMATLEEDIFGALQATPANGTERNYMRQVTARARELLKSQGIDINTADLQALLWYPEKRLFEALGVLKGQGQDTDYLEAAILQAKKEGLTDGEIQETLADTRPRPVTVTASTGEADTRSDQEDDTTVRRSIRAKPTSEIIDFATQNPEGFTFAIDTELPPQGYVVAPVKEAEIVTKTGRITEDEVNNLLLYAFEIAKLSGRPAIVGGWRNDKDGLYYLDAVHVYDNITDALYMAEIAEQEAIFDLGELNEIKTEQGLERIKSGELYNSGRRNVIRGSQKSLAKGFESFRNRRREELITDNGREIGRTDRGVGAGFTRGVPRLAYPEYQLREGPESARNDFFGVHYSNVDGLESLDANFHGSGRAGQELLRGWRPRVFFYVQKDENLPKPEQELESLRHGYAAKLNNIYDPRKDNSLSKAVQAEYGPSNRDAFEDAVEAAGYDGYVNHNFQDGRGDTAIVLLGRHNVPVVQTMINKKRVSEKAVDPQTKKLLDEKRLSDSGTIRYSRAAPAIDFNTFADEVIGQDIPTGPFTNIARKFFGAAPGEKLKDAFFRNTVNRFLPAQELDVRAYGTSFDNADSVFRSMELSQQLVGRMQALMELGPIQIDKDGNITQAENAGVGGINEIFRPLFDGMNKSQADEQERQFFAYAIARREQALRAKGRKGVSKQTDQQIADVVNRAPQMYQDVFNNFQKFNEFTIQMGIDSGILTAQMADNFRDMAYVPFYREFGMDEEQDFGDALPRRAANTLNNPNAFDKRLLGSEEKLKPDLLENIFRNQQAILSAALKNVAMQKTAKAIETLNAMGQDDIGVRVDVKESGPQIARFRVNGQEVAYKIKDGSMWKAIAGLTPPQKQGFIKAAEAFANILRFGVTNMPGFMLANLWRGKVDAYVKLGNPMLRLDQTLKGAANVYGGQTEAMAIKLLTGFGGYGYGADPSDFSATARRNIRTQGKIFNNQGFLARLQNLKQKMERVGEATEMGERVVIYERMIADGVSPREAAFQAMNLINYGRRGAGGGTLGGLIVHALIPSIPFLNARIQGLYRLGESQDQSPEAKRRIWMGIMTRGMMLSMASLLMYSTAMDEEEWDNESLENKINYDYIYVGDGDAIKLPRAFEIGSLFGTLPVMLMETIRQEDGSDLAKATLMTFGNTFSFNPVPQVFMPALEVATGHDFFRGSPIEGGSLKNKLTEERYYESTPYMYRWLSRNGGALVDLSPVEIQQLMEGYLAGFGGLIAGVGDTVLSGARLVPTDPNGVFGDPYVTRLGNVAGLSRFIAIDGERSSRFTKEFYEIKRSIDQYHRAVQDAAQRGDTERVQELMEKKGAAMTFRKAFGQVSRQIATLNNAIAQVSQSPTMSSSEKTERLRALRKQKNELTKRFVKMAKTTGYF